MRARAHASILFLALVAAGCGSSLKTGTKDAAPGADTAERRDGGLAELCTGDAPRMVANGVALTPTVVGYGIAMGCCDGGGLAVTSDALAFPIGVEWLALAGSPQTLPLTLDLASLPEGWDTQVIAGCRVTSPSCVGPHDAYQTGLLGWLTLAREPGREYEMGICVHVEEDPAAPATWLHALDLYVPRVTF
jgi:hypothetical protein